MQSPEEAGPRRQPWDAAAPLVHPHPGRAASRPPSRGRFLGRPRPSLRRCSAQMWHEGGLLHLLPLCIFALRLLICAFCFVFHLYSNICPAKHIYSNTSGTMSKVNAYVSKVCLFLPFWMVIGARILSLSTANKGPGRRVATLVVRLHYH
jgi:hypothetical protein